MTKKSKASKCRVSKISIKLFILLLVVFSSILLLSFLRIQKVECFLDGDACESVVSSTLLSELQHQPMFTLDLEKKLQNIEFNQPIAFSHLRRRLPALVEVYLVTFKPIYKLELPANVLVVGENGNIYQDNDQQLPRIKVSGTLDLDSILANNQQLKMSFHQQLMTGLSLMDDQQVQLEYIKLINLNEIELKFEFMPIMILSIENFTHQVATGLMIAENFDSIPDYQYYQEIDLRFRQPILKK